MTDKAAPKAAAAAGAMILPLALAQFIASYAATNMNVAISAIATDGEVLYGLLDCGYLSSRDQGGHIAAAWSLALAAARS